MNPHRNLAPAAYLIAGMLFFIPFFDAAMSLYPFNPANSQWRFGAFGLFSNALMIPASGALIAMATALVFGHRRSITLFTALSWLFVVGLALATVLFGLDAIQSRRLIRPDMQLSYMVATATAVVKLVLGAIGFLLLALSSRGRVVVQEARAEMPRAFTPRSSGAVVKR